MNGPPLLAEILPLSEALQRHGAEWRQLWRTAPGAAVFSAPDHAAAWSATVADGREHGRLGHGGRGGRVRGGAALVWRGPRLIGATALMQATNWRGPALLPRIDYAPYDADLAPGTRRLFPVRQLSTPVSWRAASIRPTLLTLPEDRRAVQGALALLMARHRGIDQIVLPCEEGPEAAGWLRALAGAGLQPFLHRLDRPLLVLAHPQPFEALLAGQSRNFRRRVQRARRAAAEAGLRFRILSDPDAALAALPRLAEVAAASWKADPGPSGRITVPHAGPQARFLQALLAGPAIAPVTALCETPDGQAVAALVALRHRDRLTGFATFHTGALPEASPGLLLLTEVIDWAAGAGITRFDMNATQDWVRPLCDQESTLCNVVAFLPTLRGRLYARICRARSGGGDPAETPAGASAADHWPVT